MIIELYLNPNMQHATLSGSTPSHYNDCYESYEVSYVIAERCVLLSYLRFVKLSRDVCHREFNFGHPTNKEKVLQPADRHACLSCGFTCDQEKAFSHFDVYDSADDHSKVVWLCSRAKSLE